jgi:hypothetical protein
MKKFAIGCAAVLAVVMVLGGIGLYFAYDRLLKPGIAMAGSIKELAQLGEIEKQVRNHQAFTAPENGELTQAVVDRFVKVQQDVQAKLGPRMAQLKEKQEQLDRSLSGDKRSASISEVATGLKDLAGLILDAKRAQVEALNAAGFSLKEYEWAREQVYAAIGLNAVAMDMKKMAAEAQAGNVKAFSAPERGGAVPEAPERNKVLVAPYEKQLRDWAALAFFGL